MPKMVNLASFWRIEAYSQTVLPDRSLLIGQKLLEKVKIQKFKCDILSNFQTMCVASLAIFRFQNNSESKKVLFYYSLWGRRSFVSDIVSSVWSWWWWRMVQRATILTKVCAQRQKILLVSCHLSLKSWTEELCSA